MSIDPKECKGIRVLYVEDDLDAREVSIRVFNKFFKDITVAVDGLDGLEKFKEAHSLGNDFDIILADITMPNMDGIEMLQEIKKIKSDVYSIIITAHSDRKSFQTTINAGVKGYLLKPLFIEHFIEAIEPAVKYVNTSKELNILRQYKDIVDKSTIVSKANKAGFITFVNDKFCEVSGYTREELLGQKHNLLRDPDMPPSVFKKLWNTITEKKIWKGQVKNRAKDGTSYYVDAMICPILDQNGNIYEYIGLRNVITDIISQKKQLVDAIIITEHPLLALVKIDNYHTLEHLYKRELIEKLEECFVKEIPNYLPDGCVVDKIFNLGDGEFALLKNLTEEELNAREFEIQFTKFLQNVKHNIITIDGYDFDISVIMSFATHKDQIYENVKYGLIEADEKKLDIVFSNGLVKSAKEEAIKNTKTINMIQTAIASDNIVSYFQPIINNKTMQVEKYESLVRLIDEDGKVVSPFFFLEIAKEGRYYKKITDLVIKNSVEALDKTNKDISINISALDIEDLDTRNYLVNIVTENASNANRIVFELLEDESVKDFEVVKDFISFVKAFGVQIAIDDFGAGASNFERLIDYQPDILKIDACLIKNIETDSYSRNVVETIQSFASKEGIKTVAEFVENENILSIIKNIGIDYSQGYLFGKPELL